MNSWIEAWDAESAVQIRARDLHTPDRLRGIIFLSHFVYVGASSKSSNTAKVVFNVAVCELFRIAAIEIIEIGRQYLMEGQRSRFRALVNLPDRDRRVETRWGSRAAARNARRKDPVIPIVHHTKRKDTGGVRAEERGVMLRIFPVGWICSAFESEVSPSPKCHKILPSPVPLS